MTRRLAHFAPLPLFFGLGMVSTIVSRIAALGALERLGRLLPPTPRLCRPGLPIPPRTEHMGMQYA